MFREIKNSLVLALRYAYRFTPQFRERNELLSRRTTLPHGNCRGQYMQS